MDRLPDDVKKFVLGPMLTEKDKNQILYVKVMEFKTRATKKQIATELLNLAIRYLNEWEFQETDFKELGLAMEIARDRNYHTKKTITEDDIHEFWNRYSEEASYRLR